MAGDRPPSCGLLASPERGRRQREEDEEGGEEVVRRSPAAMAASRGVPTNSTPLLHLLPCAINPVAPTPLPLLRLLCSALCRGVPCPFLSPAIAELSSSLGAGREPAPPACPDHCLPPPLSSRSEFRIKRRGGPPLAPTEPQTCMARRGNGKMKWTVGDFAAAGGRQRRDLFTFGVFFHRFAQFTVPSSCGWSCCGCRCLGTYPWPVVWDVKIRGLWKTPERLAKFLKQLIGPEGKKELSCYFAESDPNEILNEGNLWVKQIQLSVRQCSS